MAAMLVVYGYKEAPTQNKPASVCNKNPNGFASQAKSPSFFSFSGHPAREKMRLKSEISASHPLPAKIRWPHQTEPHVGHEARTTPAHEATLPALDESDPDADETGDHVL
jgi:hypothetical protein